MIKAVSPWVARPVIVDDAARKAIRCFPGIIGEVLAAEILSVRQFTFLGEGSRAARLMAAVAELPEPAEMHIRDLDPETWEVRNGRT